MSNIVARVTNNRNITAKVTPQNEILVTNYQVNSSTVKIDDLLDVQVGNLQDGALLSYDANTETWKALSVIENPNTEINGGFF